MKTLLSFSLIILSFSAISSDDLLKKCGPLAEKVATKKFGKNYDQDGIWAYECGLAPNKAVVVCDLGASKGDGGATDTLRVVLDKTCSKAYSAKIISVE